MTNKDRRTTATDVLGQFIISMFGMAWVFVVGAFYFIAPWIFFYILIKIFE